MASKSRKRITITPTIVIGVAFTDVMHVAFTGAIAVATTITPTIVIGVAFTGAIAVATTTEVEPCDKRIDESNGIFGLNIFLNPPQAIKAAVSDRIRRCG
jgi:hypothetical protein